MKIKKLSNPHIIVLGLVAGLLVIQFLLNRNHPEESQTLGYVVLVLVVLSALFRSFANLIANLWVGLGVLLGKINSTILLTLVYFLILTPLSFLKSWLSKESSSFKPTKETGSAFIKREHTFSAKDIEHPW